MTNPHAHLIVTCRRAGCTARIILAYTDNGETMPLDNEPKPNGNITVTPTPHGLLARIAKKRHLPGLRASGVPLYLHHRPSCANPPPKKRRPTKHRPTVP